MKKKIIIAISIIILLVFTAIISIYSFAWLLRIEATEGLRIPQSLRSKIVGLEATYGPNISFVFLQLIIFLFYLLFFSVIIFLIVRLIRKIKERNRI